MSYQCSPNTNPFLPIEVYSHIFSHLPQQTLKFCRFLSHSVAPFATALAFDHIYLSPSIPESPNAFINIAKSPHLRSQVSEITVDTWLGPDYRYNANENFEWPLAFLRALPYLRFFSGTEILNVRFTEWCGNQDREGDIWGPTYDETYDFRWRVLGTVFECAAGLWTQGMQAEWEDVLLEQRSDQDSDASQSEDAQAEVLSGTTEFSAGLGTPLLKTLTVSNLADYNDERITGSQAFEKVMQSPLLTELKLLITTESDEAAPENSIQFPERYEFFGSLSKTWLRPSVATKLEVLSLYYTDYWGWVPRCEFRAFNPGYGPTDPTAGFPKLRVLAMGNYVFSHDWQIDWIASLGQQNGHGGLQELYLDDCPIMWYAQLVGPMEEGTTTVTLNKDEHGNEAKSEISNDGYYREDIITGEYDGDTEWGLIRTWDTRWSDILSRWRESMALKVFRMGHGSWGGELTELVRIANQPPVAATEEDDAEEMDDGHRFEHRHHINYDCPTTSRKDESWYDNTDEMTARIAARLKHGAGLRQEREDLLQYIQFDIGLGPTQWITEDYSNPEASEMEDPSERRRPGCKEVMSRDEEALDEFLAAIAQRKCEASRGKLC